MMRSSTVSGTRSKRMASAGKWPRGRRNLRSGRSTQANQPAAMPAKEPLVYCIRAAGVA